MVRGTRHKEPANISGFKSMNHAILFKDKLLYSIFYLLQIYQSCLSRWKCWVNMASPQVPPLFLPTQQRFTQQQSGAQQQGHAPPFPEWAPALHLLCFSWVSELVLSSYLTCFGMPQMTRASSILIDPPPPLQVYILSICLIFYWEVWQLCLPLQRSSYRRLLENLYLKHLNRWVNEKGEMVLL